MLYSWFYRISFAFWNCTQSREFIDFLSLAEKVASVIGCSIISMENYGTGNEDGNDLNSTDFDLLVQNLKVWKSFLDKKYWQF